MNWNVVQDKKRRNRQNEGGRVFVVVGTFHKGAWKFAGFKTENLLVEIPRNEKDKKSLLICSWKHRTQKRRHILLRTSRGMGEVAFSPGWHNLAVGCPITCVSKQRLFCFSQTSKPRPVCNFSCQFDLKGVLTNPTLFSNYQVSIDWIETIVGKGFLFIHNGLQKNEWHCCFQSCKVNHLTNSSK